MQTVVLAFNAVFPLLAFMMTGFFLKRKGFFKGNSTDELNKLVFKVFLPLNIFTSIYTCDLKSSFKPDVALYVACNSIIAFIVLSLIIPLIEKDRRNIPVMVQGIHKSNYNLLAATIVANFFGENLGMAMVLTGIITPIVNTCSAVAFESARGGTANLKSLLKKVITNPLVVASLSSIALNLIGFPIPNIIVKSVMSKMSTMATPLALMSLGATFEFEGIRKYSRQLSIVCLGKLFLYPLITIPLAVFFGISGPDLIAVTVFCACPTAVNSYSTAVSMGGNGEFAGSVVILTSILSIFTLFGWFCAIGFMGWL